MFSLTILKEKKVDWMFGFYGISLFVGYLMPNSFYMNNQFYFKQFRLAYVYILIVRKHFYLELFSLLKLF